MAASTSTGASTDAEDPLEWELPKLVGNVRQGQINAFTASAVVTALFVGIEVSFLTGGSPLTTLPANKDTGGLRPNVRLLEAELALAYMSIGLGIGSTAASLFLIVYLATLDSPHSDEELTEARMYTSAHGILVSLLGNSKSCYNYTLMYWGIILALAYIAVIIQCGLYVWLHESNLIASLATPAVFVAALPLLLSLIGIKRSKGKKGSTVPENALEVVTPV